MKSNTEKIFYLIGKFESKKIMLPTDMNKFEMFILTLAAALLFLGGALAIFSKHSSLVWFIAILLLVFSQLCAYGFLIVYFLKGLRFMLSTKAYFECLKKIVFSEEALLNELKQQPLADLKYLKVRFEYEIQALLGRMIFFIGPIDRLGFFPVIIAIGGSMYSFYSLIHAQGSFFSQVITGAIFGILGWYVGGMIVIGRVNKLKYYLYLFDAAIDENVLEEFIQGG